MKHDRREHPRALDLASCGWTVRLSERGPAGADSQAAERVRGRGIPAEIPGCIHTDLMRAGLIPDPAVSRHELDVQWVSECDWTYRRRFEVPRALVDRGQVDLVCDGLDTIAEVAVNGRSVGAAANMFRPHRFDLRGNVRPGENEIEATFRSPLRHIREEEARLGPRPVNGDWDPYVFIRKAACNFGWDWGPRVATCGIWRPIRIEGWDGVRIDAVRPLVYQEGDDRWSVRVHADLAWAETGLDPVADSRVLCILLEGGPGERWAEQRIIRRGQSSVTVSLTLTNPRLWWPRGWGEQNLYRLRVWLADQPVAAADVAEHHPSEWCAPIGFRTVKLLTGPDPAGSRFAIQVNGREVFCKGANWIPEGLFPSDRSPARVRRRVAQAAAANMNMLRVWGGGFYEDPAFYEECDRLGIMVWQDFMFACAMYPEEEPIRTEVELEARHQVARLSRHPSVVLWCGGNECVWAHEGWGGPPHGLWKQRLGTATWGSGYYFDLLPRAVAELDPTRPYWANSPWPGPGLAEGSATPNDSDRGDRHTWDERIDGYTKAVPRFCSEFGHQSPSCRATLARVLVPEEMRVGSPALEHRQRGTGGTAQHIDGPLAEWFRPAASFDEWHYLAQLLQARAMRIGVEWLRVNRPRCMGALIWQLNDAWPGMSWSLIDADGREKPACRAVREAMGDRIIAIGPRHEKPAVWLCNDMDEPWRGVVSIGRRMFDGRPIGAPMRAAFELPARSARRIIEVESACGRPDDPTRELVMVEADGLRRCWYHLPDRELWYPAPEGRVEMGEDASRRPIAKIHAATLIRDLGGTLAGREVAGELGTVFPGEVAVLSLTDNDNTIGRSGSIDAGSWPSGLLCANRFGAGERGGPAITP